MELVSVSEAADRLGVSAVRVRQMIHAGRLPARKIAGRWTIEQSDLGRRRVVSRPMSEPMAWALIGMLSGAEVYVAPVERRRLEAKLERLASDPRPLALLRSWLASRAERVRLSVPAADVANLGADSRVCISGVSDRRSGIVALAEVEGYVRRRDLDVLRREYLMAPAAGASAATLHVCDRRIPRPAPIGAVIADLADWCRPREDRSAEKLLREALR